jgi:glycerol-3-phosphate acyltransferase PlsY
MLSFILILSGVMLGSYCLGSLCSAVIVAQICHLPDPRTEGSRNPGTTNVLRIAGKKYAIIVLLADLLKGLVPVLLLRWLHFAPDYLGYVGLVAVLGHIYPVFFNFKGGKGVATSLGVIFGLSGWLGLAVVATWIAVAWLSRYSSLAGLVALGLAPLYAWGLMLNTHWIIALIALAGIIIYQHQENIARLWQGKESKIKL